MKFKIKINSLIGKRLRYIGSKKRTDGDSWPDFIILAVYSSKNIIAIKGASGKHSNTEENIYYDEFMEQYENGEYEEIQD